MSWLFRLSPVRTDQPMRYAVAGSTLLVWPAAEPWEDFEAAPPDAEAFDFGPLPDQAQLPRAAVGEGEGPPLWLVSPVERAGDVLTLTVVLGLAPGAPDEACFPQPVGVLEDGPVPLPWAGFLPPPPPPPPVPDPAPEEEQPS